MGWEVSFQKVGHVSVRLPSEVFGFFVALVPQRLVGFCLLLFFCAL